MIDFNLNIRLVCIAHCKNNQKIKEFPHFYNNIYNDFHPQYRLKVLHYYQIISIKHHSEHEFLDIFGMEKGIYFSNTNVIAHRLQIKGKDKQLLDNNNTLNDPEVVLMLKSVISDLEDLRSQDHIKGSSQLVSMIFAFEKKFKIVV